MLEEDEFVDLINAMPRLTEMNMDCLRDFGDSAWGLLKAVTPRHLATIRIMKVDATGLSAGALIDILCSLPNLEVFRGDYITDQDLRKDPRPWACRRTLKSLELNFEVTSRKQVLAQKLIVKRLAELEQLEELDVSDSYLQLDLSKPKGLLTSLRTLKHLKTFSMVSQLEDFNCDWGLAEIAWVREHLPKLKYVDWIEYKDEVREEDKYPPIPR